MLCCAALTYRCCPALLWPGPAPPCPALSCSVSFLKAIYVCCRLDKSTRLDAFWSSLSRHITQYLPRQAFCSSCPVSYVYCRLFIFCSLALPCFAHCGARMHSFVCNTLQPSHNSINILGLNSITFCFICALPFVYCHLFTFCFF